MTDTLRNHVEGIRVALTLGETLRAEQLAVAALKLLDEAERLVKRDGTQNRLVPDPGSSSPDATPSTKGVNDRPDTLTPEDWK